MRGGMGDDGHEVSILIRPGGADRAGRAPSKVSTKDHSAAAPGASMRRRRCLSVIVRLGGRALGRGEQLADALDVVGANGSCEQAIVADAVEAGRQQVQEKAADELVDV